MNNLQANNGTRLIKEERIVVFRGEEFSCIHHSWEDVKTHERYTADELDDINVNQIYAPYRKKYGIPDEREIAAMKEV